ncbi:MAG: ABC transporter ATP-binding protein [Candidatus Woesearchaeota archaeon]|jgi:putative ABC transport system ATP-binding protein
METKETKQFHNKPILDKLSHDKRIVIELKDVWKIYDLGEVKVEALKGINLKIKKGEFVAIKGASGSGKSTAVNQIGCLDIPTKGEINLDGYNISKMSESNLAKIRGRKIGFIFQQFNLIPTLTAFENITLPMIFQGASMIERRVRGDYLLNMVGLKEREDHKPNELSGGQQQRVAIARALVNDPEVILADEPTGALDSKTGLTVINFLEELHEQGKTIIMVTHDDKLAKFADRIVILSDGMILSDEKNDEKDKFVKQAREKLKELNKSESETKKYTNQAELKLKK